MAQRAVQDHHKIMMDQWSFGDGSAGRDRFLSVAPHHNSPPPVRLQNFLFAMARR
jgi:hypothetical protein